MLEASEGRAVLNRVKKGCAVVLGVVGLAAVSPTAAGATTGIGETFTPSGGAAACGGDRTWLEYPVPADGVITSWSFLADSSPPQLKFKLARPTTTVNQYTVIAESGLKTPVPNVLNTYPIQAATRAGDLIGFYTATMNDCLRGISTGPTTFERDGEAALNVPATFAPETVQLDVAATLEPDPETSITEHPRRKAKKTKARFAFTSSVPGSTFECSLDGRAFSPCGSPDAFKVKRGRHTFAVQARGPLGNADSTPASYEWKVKKKKRR
jgi:hypothetical protein